MAMRFNVYVEGDSDKHVFVERDDAERFMRECREQGKSCICPAIEAKTGIRFRGPFRGASAKFNPPRSRSA